MNCTFYLYYFLNLKEQNNRRQLSIFYLTELKILLILHLTSCHIDSNNCNFAFLLKHTFESDYGKDY